MNQTMWFFIGLQLMVIGLVSGSYYLKRRKVQKTLEDVSQLIQHLIHNQETEVFSPLKDDMPSKLQVQITRLENILRSQRDQSQKEKRELQALVGDITHQLKTPLTNIGIYTELLEDQQMDGETYKEMHRGVRREVEKFQFLMEALVKMSRLESGVIQVIPEVSSIESTCLLAIKRTHIKAKQKDITLVFDCKKNIDVCHDSKWTSEAIENLIDNAIKYSPSQTQITVKVIPYEIFVRIDIIDEGEGIKEELHGKIFERFYRGEEYREIEGVGIGLYLARKIVSDQNGYIKVESKLGSGSKFSVFLPI